MSTGFPEIILSWMTFSVGFLQSKSEVRTYLTLSFSCLFYAPIYRNLSFLNKNRILLLK